MLIMNDVISPTCSVALYPYLNFVSQIILICKEEDRIRPPYDTDSALMNACIKFEANRMENEGGF